MSDKMLYTDALVAIAKREPLQVSLRGANQWHDVTLTADGTEVMAMGMALALDRLLECEFRRPPTTPRVHELPAKWRAGMPSTMFGAPGKAYRTADGCADDLEAALKAGEWVDLRAVDAAELRRKASAIAVHSHVAEERGRNFVGALLAVLREKAAKP